MWTQQRSELNIKRIESMAMVKYNTSQSCTEFYELVKKNGAILEAIRKGEKYEKAKVKDKEKRPLRLNNETVDLISCCEEDWSDEELDE